MAATKYKEFAFSWRGKNQHGEITSGEYTATNKAAVKQYLFKKAIIPLKIKKVSAFTFNIWRAPLTKKEVFGLLKNLSYALDAGVSLAECLPIMIKSEPDARSRQLLSTVLADVMGGNSLADAVSKYPQYFDTATIKLIHLGGEAHALSSVLHQISSYIDKKAAITRKVKKALIYPASIFVVSAIVSWILLTFAVPQFEKIFMSAKVPLPAITQGVIDFSNFLQTSWWIIIIGLLIIGLSAGYMFTVAKVKANKLLLKLPVIGSLLTKTFIISYARSIAISLEAGMPLVQSLGLAAQGQSNPLFNQLTSLVSEDVSRGSSFYHAVIKHRLFTNNFVQMVGVGETAHNLAKIMFNVADALEQEIEYHVDTLMSFVETAVIVLLGVFIGVFVLAMYMPMFNIGKAI